MFKIFVETRKNSHLSHLDTERVKEAAVKFIQYVKKYGLIHV